MSGTNDHTPGENPHENGSENAAENGVENTRENAAQSGAQGYPRERSTPADENSGDRRVHNHPATAHGR